MTKHPEQMPQENAKPDAAKEITSPEIESFFNQEAEILGAYGMRGDIGVERGKLPDDVPMGFSTAERKIYFDPESSFFKEQKYGLKETLFVVTHELMAHYAQLLRDPELVAKEVARYQRHRPELNLLHNIFEDVLGNRRIVAELPFLENTEENLYKKRQFPQTDYRRVKDPKTGEERELASHVQFAYGFIRQAMVPGEPVTVGPEAQAALDKLRSFGEGKTDVLDLVTTPSIEPRDHFKLMRQIVEPVYLDLYKKDLEKEVKKQSGSLKAEVGGEPKAESRPGSGWWKKESKKKPGKKESGKGDENGEGKRKKEMAARRAAEEKFREQYRIYEQSHPEPLAREDEEKIIETAKEIAKERGGQPSLDRSILEQWAREHGVNVEDVIGYRREYQDIQPFIVELREVFKKIVAARLERRWRVRPQLEREGEELESSAIAEAYLESKSGGEPRAFREIERQSREGRGYGALDMSLVNDLSGSMSEGGGSKLDMDRKSKILFLEALADFQEEIEEAEYENGTPLGLGVRTETRAFGDFGDAVLKELSSGLSEKERIGIWKKLRQAGGGTPDYLSLEAIASSLTPQDEREIKGKIRRKVVVVLSDGESESVERTQKALADLRERGVIVLGLGMTASGQAVKDTYKPDATVVEDINQLPQAVQGIILQYTQDL